MAELLLLYDAKWWHLLKRLDQSLMLNSLAVDNLSWRKVSLWETVYAIYKKQDLHGWFIVRIDSFH